MPKELNVSGRNDQTKLLVPTSAGKFLYSLGSLPAIFLFMPTQFGAIMNTMSWVLLLLVLLLAGGGAFALFYIKKQARYRERVEEQLHKKVLLVQEMQEEFEKMQDDLKTANKTVERKSRDLKMINHILDLKVERKTRELQDANNDLSTFLYRSSHDILGPMARLTGLCNLAQMEVKDPTAQGYLGKMEQTANELNMIIKNINDVFEIKNRELELGTCNMKDTLQNVIDNEFDDEMKNEVNFVLEIDPGLNLTTDLELFHTICYELIKNSLIHRSLSYREEPSRITVNVEKRAKKVLMCVDDNGSGVPKELEEKVFNMFQRSSTLSKGTGMGLYIVKCALQRMKGSIEYKSKDEPGARFELQIPNFQTS